MPSLGHVEGDLISPPKIPILLYISLLVLSSCVSNAQAGSIVLIDSGYQSDLISLNSMTAGRTVGWEFTPISDVWVTQLGFFDLGQNGLNIVHSVGIWSLDQQLLISASVPSGQEASLTGSYRYVSVPSTRLSAGQTFIIGATIQVSMSVPGFESDFYPNNTVQLNPMDIVFDPRISPGAANRYAQGNITDMFELDFPDGEMPTKNFADPLTGQAINIGHYFFAANFAFSQSNPEPTTLTLLVMGTTALLARSSRRRRDSQLNCRKME